MEKIDARTLNQEAQEALRKQIVRLRKAGRSHKEIAERLAISEKTVENQISAAIRFLRKNVQLLSIFLLFQ